MSYKQKLKEMYDLIAEGKTFEALDQYYHENAIVIDGNSEPRNGRDAQKKAVEEWYSMVKEFHGSGVSAITSDEENGHTTVEAWTEVTFQDGRHIKMEEVGVQKWEGDKIVHERFYYSMPEGASNKQK